MGRAILYIVLLGVVFTSCERELDLNLPEKDAPIVVEGYVENGEIPYVILAKGTGFFDAIDSSTFSKLGIFNAKVMLNNGDQTVELITDERIGFPIYGAVDRFGNTTMLGEAGKTYKLTIEVDGEKIEATTQVLQPVPLDSMYVVPLKSNPKKLQLFITLSEPGLTKNYYRAMTKTTRDENFDTDFGSLFDDLLVNGTTFNFPLNSGSSREDTTSAANEFGLFNAGDTIIVKWIHLTKPNYNFWITFENQVNSIGSPFANPTVIKSNVSSGVGVWSDYASFYDTLITTK
jgi:hypothetical protein